MIELHRKTALRARSKLIAGRSHSATPPFFRWNNPTQSYEFGIELNNGATGETFELTAHQLEWEDLFEKLRRCFGEAPA